MDATPNLLVVRQSAVIPIHDGQICLVTSRSGKRWVIPKGKIDPEHTPIEAALVEAWEEAGLVGVVRGDAIGSFYYEKLGKTYHVIVYVMEVTSVANAWPEQTSRQREWLDCESAACRVIDEGLPNLIRAAMGAETFV